MRASGQVWRLLRIAVGVALLVYVVRGSNWHMTGSLLTTPWLVGILVGLPLLGASIEAVRLGVLYEAQRLHLPFTIGFRVVAIAAFFNFCIPGATGGDIVKVWYLNAVARRRGVEIAAIWLVDRLTGLFSLLLLLVAVGTVNIPFVGGHPALQWLLGSAVLALLTMVALAVLACTRPARGLLAILALYAPARNVVTRVAQSIAVFRYRPGALVKAVGISFAGHVALLATFVALGRVLMPDVAPRLVSLLTLFGLFANAVPLTPGGLGVGEAAFDTLFRLAGAAGGAGLLLAWRIGMMPLCLVGWMLYVVGVRHRTPPVQEGSANTAAALP